MTSSEKKGQTGQARLTATLPNSALERGAAKNAAPLSFSVSRH
jgi:hypothetical protein